MLLANAKWSGWCSIGEAPYKDSHAYILSPTNLSHFPLKPHPQPFLDLFSLDFPLPLYDPASRNEHLTALAVLSTAIFRYNVGIHKRG